MFDPKIIFWIVVALLLSTLAPDTIVKMFAVFWILLVGHLGFVRLCFWLGKRKGAITVSFGCEYRAHSIHCATMGLSPSDGECNCVPSHPANCGHC